MFFAKNRILLDWVYGDGYDKKFKTIRGNEMVKTLSPRQAARSMGFSEASLKRWCDQGLLPSSRTAGGHRRLPVSGVVQFLRKSGQPLVRPELLGLPGATGRGVTSLEHGAADARKALENGDEARLRRIAFDLYLANHSIPEVCDSVIAPAFHALGERWQHGEIEVYQERLGCEITTRLLYELRAVLPPPGQDAPTAIGATLPGNPYTLPTAMVEVTLYESGWRAQSYGIGNPAETLCVAIKKKSPALFWLSVSCIEGVDRFLEDYGMLYDWATPRGGALVVGGRALAENIRRQMRYSAYCDTLGHLSSFATTIYRPQHEDPNSK